MAINKKRLPIVPANQPALFATAHADGSFDSTLELKAAMSQSIKKCTLPRGRYDIASEMSKLLSRDITKTQIDHITSESGEQYRPHADFLVAFCFVTKSFEPFEALLNPIDGALVVGTEKTALELMRVEREIKSLTHTAQELRARSGL